MPAWALSAFAVTIRAGDPVRLYLKQVSDHAPVSVSLVLKPLSKDRHKPTPSHVTRSKAFQQHLVAILKVAELNKYHGFARLDKQKQVTRQAAKHALNQLIIQQPKDPGTECIMMGTVVK